MRGYPPPRGTRPPTPALVPRLSPGGTWPGGNLAPPECWPGCTHSLILRHFARPAHENLRFVVFRRNQRTIVFFFSCSKRSEEESAKIVEDGENRQTAENNKNRRKRRTPPNTVENDETRRKRLKSTSEMRENRRNLILGPGLGVF